MCSHKQNMSEPRIWVLVADGDAARLYCSDGDMRKLEPALPCETLVADFGPGAPMLPYAAFDEADIWNETVETPDVPGPELFRDPRLPFADQLARLLQDAAFDDEYDALIIAAAPTLMRNLDLVLSAETRARLMGCVTGNLMHLGPAGLSAFLRARIFH